MFIASVFSNHGNQTVIIMKLLAKACVARLWVMLLFSSLSMVTVSAVSSAVSIGQRYQGGIVFYVDESRQHGLIAATRDLPGEYDWQGAKDAGERFVDGGFSDWYLPGKRELNELYKSKSAVRGFADGTHSDCRYWSSSEKYIEEYNVWVGWFQWFNNDNLGKQDTSGKGDDMSVRAIRAF